MSKQYKVVVVLTLMPGDTSTRSRVGDAVVDLFDQEIRRQLDTGTTRCGVHFADIALSVIEEDG